MFRGAYTALVTPFENGRVDDEAIERLVERQIADGIHGLVPCGTTGESATLSYAEHIHVVEVTMRAAKGRVPVLAGAGSNSTREAIELGRACKELGVDGTLQVVPYYNKPSQQGLIRHFTEIADTVGLPVVLYNVPGRTVADLQAETVAELAKHELIVGIKEATADMYRAQRIRELCGPDFSLLSGDDFTILPFLAQGGDGVVSVVSNVVPGLIAQLCDAVAAGDLAKGRELHYRQLPLTRALFVDANPMPVKAAMAHLGIMTHEIRSPLVPFDLESGAAALLLSALAEIGAKA